MKMNIDNISFKVDTQIINFIKVVENKKMIRTYLFIEFIKSFGFD